MKIDIHNFLGDRFSSIPDINRVINIDYIDFWFSSIGHSWMSGHKTVHITEPPFYQIVKIERCGNCRSRNLTNKFCTGTLQMSLKC